MLQAEPQPVGHAEFQPDGHQSVHHDEEHPVGQQADVLMHQAATDPVCGTSQNDQRAAEHQPVEHQKPVRPDEEAELRRLAAVGPPAGSLGEHLSRLPAGQDLPLGLRRYVEVVHNVSFSEDVVRVHEWQAEKTRRRSKYNQAFK